MWGKYEKINYKKKTSIILALLFYICIISLCACENPWVAKKLDMYNVEWRIENNDYGIELKYTKLRKDDIINYGFIEYKNKHINVSMSCGRGVFILRLVNIYGEDVSNFDVPNFSTGNNLIPFYMCGDCSLIKNGFKFYVEEDYLFDGELEGKELIVAPHKINPVDYGIGLHQSVEWKNNAKNISLITQKYSKNFSIGTYNNTKIVTYWLDNDRFTMYEIVDDVQQNVELACGSYEYTEEKVVLFFEKNTISTHYTITLVGRATDSINQTIWYPQSDEPISR